MCLKSFYTKIKLIKINGSVILVVTHHPPKSMLALKKFYIAKLRKNYKRTHETQIIMILKQNTYWTLFCHSMSTLAHVTACVTGSFCKTSGTGGSCWTTEQFLCCLRPLLLSNQHLPTQCSISIACYFPQTETTALDPRSTWLRMFHDTVLLSSIILAWHISQYVNCHPLTYLIIGISKRKDVTLSLLIYAMCNKCSPTRSSLLWSCSQPAHCDNPPCLSGTLLWHN